MTTVDSRLTAAGITITATQLVDLWADHYPAHIPANTAPPATCPGCGHTYTPTAPLCPTAAIVRPLLRRRRYEADPAVLARLTFNQQYDLLSSDLSTARTRPAEPRPAPKPAAPGLFDPAPYYTGGTR